MSDNDSEALSALLKEMDKLATQEEKQAHLLNYLSNKNKNETPQVIGLPENASANDAEPCL